MAAGLPIVASKDPIRLSLIGTIGYFTNLTPADVAENLMRAIGKKPLNYQRTLMPYQPDRIAAKLTLHFRSLLKSK